MSDTVLKYKFSNYALFLTVLLAIGISWYFKWHYAVYPLNFMGGDAKDYYSGLVSIFITHDFTNQAGNDWFLLKTSTGTINVHSIGVSVLLLPFFALASLVAFLFHFPLDGYSFPYQLMVATAALGYAVIGLVYLRKLFQLHEFGDKLSATLLLLLFFGTNLLNYTLSEAGLSHVYSFGLISAFLYHSSRFVLLREDRNLLSAFLLLGLIILVRPNNVLIVLSIFMWFKNWESCKQFFTDLFKNKTFYKALALCTLLVFLQSLVWFIQSKSFLHNTYKADGFYWLHPQTLKMLFGFNGGFFIYTPLFLLFFPGLIVMFRQNKFSFFATAFFIVGLLYFFSCYWAYNYFDGLGIRVLVDYYALFSFIGAKFFFQLSEKTIVYQAVLFVSGLFTVLNLIYCYQANRNILARDGMNFTKWRYVFLRTAPAYQNVLGGNSEITPYSKTEQKAVAQRALDFSEPFDFANKEYGLTLSFDSLGLKTRRIQLRICCSRKELTLNASRDAFICVALEDGISKKNKFYSQYKLNDAPALSCCDTREYTYTPNIQADFREGDRLSVYLWNHCMQGFLVSKFSAALYNYDFEIN